MTIEEIRQAPDAGLGPRPSESPDVHTLDPSEESPDDTELIAGDGDEEIDPLSDPGDDSFDDETDGDRQLTTESDVIDGGTNDSDLGAEASGPILDKYRKP